MANKLSISKSAPDIYQVSGRYFPGTVITLMADDGHPIGAIQVSNHVELEASFHIIPFNLEK